MTEKEAEAIAERFGGVIDMVGYLDALADISINKAYAEIIRQHAREGEEAIRELMGWVVEIYHKGNQ